MRAQILDSAALRSISVAALSAFARSEGWTRTDRYGEYADIYSGDDLPEIILPRTEGLADYASAHSRLIEIFANTTGRNEIQIFKDLVCADRDVVRVRTYGTDDDGTVSLETGVSIVEKSRDLLLAAACATQIRQSVYRAGANRDAIDYMSRVRLGQTEHGSYVVTMLSPVSPALNDIQPVFDMPGDFTSFDPIERQVTRRLMTALKASRSAVESAQSGTSGAFDKAVSAGVSANLCEAVAGLVEQSNGLDISVTWALTRPVHGGSQKVAFTRNDAAFLEEAARMFRLRQPQLDVTLYGTVNQLKRDHQDIDGFVNLKVIIENKMQSVRAFLGQADYQIAVEAHASKVPVMVTGDLERVGQRWQLARAAIRPVPNEEGPGPDELWLTAP